MALLAEDTPPLRRMRGRLLDWIAERRPHWFAETESDISIRTQPRARDTSATDNEM